MQHADVWEFLSEDDCWKSWFHFQANVEPFGSSSSTSNNMTVRYSSSCPVDHSQDADIVQNFYKTIRSYSLPKIPNVTLQTVHRYEQKTLIKFLSEKREALKKRMDFFHTRGEAGPNPHFYKTVDKRVVFCSVYAVLPFFYPSWLQNYIFNV